MKIIVTGGAGYIGSHTVVELQNNGYEVIIIDNLCNSDISVIERITSITKIMPKFYNIDLKDKTKTREFFKTQSDIAGIIHFAALKAVGESMEKPLLYYRNNIDSLLNILECMGEFNINNIVFSSSCTVYGQADKLPVNEQTPQKKAWSAYGNTKQISEQILEFISNTHDIKTIALRYFNPIGAHESAQIGELPIGTPNNLVPFITQTAIGKRECLNVFGSDYNTTDGTAIRDYIHVVDVAKAHVSALKHLLNIKTKNYFEAFNIGTGKGFSVLDVIKSFEKVSSVKLNYKFVEKRAGDIEQVWADTSYANKILNWVAEKSLDEMMISAWNWEQKLN